MCSLNKYSLLGPALQKLKVSVLAKNESSGVPAVVHGNDDDSLKENSISQTKSKNNDDIITLGRSIEQHGLSQVNIAKIEADDKEKELTTHQMKMELQNTLRQIGGGVLFQYNMQPKVKRQTM